MKKLAEEMQKLYEERKKKNPDTHEYHIGDWAKVYTNMHKALNTPLWQKHKKELCFSKEKGEEGGHDKQKREGKKGEGKKEGN